MAGIPRLRQEARQLYRYFGIWPQPGCERPWHRGYRIRLLNAIRAWQTNGQPATDWHALAERLMKSARRYEALAGADEDRQSAEAIQAALSLSNCHIVDVEKDADDRRQMYVRVDIQIPGERLSQAERSRILNRLGGEWDEESCSVFVPAIEAPRQDPSTPVTLETKLWLEQAALAHAKMRLAPTATSHTWLDKVCAWVASVQFEWRLARI